MLLGIDEVGRGPIAGPLVLCGIIFDYNKIELNDPNFLQIRDSKKLSKNKREELSVYIKKISLFCDVALVDNNFIDKNGISYSLAYCILKILKNLINEDIYINEIIFDGNFNPLKKNSLFLIDKFEKEYDFLKRNNVKFETLVGADDKVKEVASASIVAKVIRDRILDSYSKIYPNYGFDKNKGYCTKDHYGAIKIYGYSKIHRRSFKIFSNL